MGVMGGYHSSLTETWSEKEGNHMRKTGPVRPKDQLPKIVITYLVRFQWLLDWMRKCATKFCLRSCWAWHVAETRVPRSASTLGYDLRMEFWVCVVPASGTLPVSPGLGCLAFSFGTPSSICLSTRFRPLSDLPSPPRPQKSSIYLSPFHRAPPVLTALRRLPHWFAFRSA
jgi:hypothetical protein